MRIARASAALLFIGCATTQTTPSASDARTRAEQIVAAPDRTPEDRALDPGRKPVETLLFLQVRPGMHVAELGAGGGYTAELLARAVAPGGVVYAQNPQAFQRFIQTSLPARMARPAMKDAVRVDREFDDPLPPEAKNLDLVVMNAIYHDVSYMNVDRDKMNKAIFATLKPGGAFVVIDASAKEGAGTSDAQTLHRIDEQVVRTEVLRAGFKLESEGDFLRNPQDARDWNQSPAAAAAANRRGTSDRFALRFVKP
jgi:predicted methyltransferase